MDVGLLWTYMCSFLAVKVFIILQILPSLENQYFDDVIKTV